MQISKTFLACGIAALCLAAVSARAVDSEKDARLREALRQKMSELGPESPAEPVKPAKVTAPKKQATPAKTMTPAAESAPPAAVPATADDSERMREALRARMQQEAPAASAAPETTAQAVASPTQAAPPAAVNKGPVTFQAPASPVAGSKEQRLQQLLQQYKADQITPEQYHQERAKILAE